MLDTRMPNNYNGWINQWPQSKLTRPASLLQSNCYEMQMIQRLLISSSEYLIISWSGSATRSAYASVVSGPDYIFFADHRRRMLFTRSQLQQIYEWMRCCCFATEGQHSTSPWYDQSHLSLPLIQAKHLSGFFCLIGLRHDCSKIHQHPKR